MGMCISTETSSKRWPPEMRLSRRKQKVKERMPERGGGAAPTVDLPEDELNHVPHRMVSSGSSHVACLHTQQGKKGTNQDAMVVWEDFASQNDSVFCGVFDGHGPYGHFVARNVRNSFPLKLLARWKPENDSENTGPPLLQQNGSLLGSMNSEESVSIHSVEEEWSDGDEKFPEVYVPLKRAFRKACKLVDKELKLHPTIDCFCSGSTAVTLVKQGHDLIIGNIGDSRAVLGTRDDDNHLIAVQLTVDLKPNLPREAERIQKCKGRVFALQDEPDVSRVWLPNNDAPGLAMARAFGDFCLKDYGLISVPDVSYRRLTERDEFVILATDGIWDALSNKEAVDIVASAPSRSTAARALVDCAVRSWRLKYPTSKVDDCAVVCLFLNNAPSEKLEKHKQPLPEKQEEKQQEHVIKPVPQAQNSTLERFDTFSAGCSEIEIEPVIEEEEISHKQPEKSQSTRSLAECILMSDEDEWSALEGVTRVNSLLSLPRFLLRDKKSSSRRKSL
ncbi:hypothetical protein LUZ63_008351 [Rhynchospora breviuscula]|uniref:protein-serine/threonine phosphatase n=1 Tax=Rhynchospora breviuscula TaxID=2022672 RepID=A0A9Q0HVA3_9POAL|nr:hypothetical protein LUZ63_008351 [Rhynchospora breviuscula]